MAAGQDKLYRNRDGLIAGVCSGLARYFQVDVGVLRLFAVLFAFLTCGIMVLVYIALWLVLPLEPTTPSTVDVAPESIASEVYDQVVSGKNATTTPPPSSAVGSGHMPPPRPPEADSPSDGAFGAYTAAAVTGAAPDAGKSSNTAPYSYVPASAKLGLIAGIVLVTMGIAVLISNWIHVFSFLQFWPLLLVAGGIVRMVIPDKRGYLMDDFLLGLFLFVGGAMLLPQTLGIIIYDYSAFIRETWPVLTIAVGLLVLGHAYKSSVLLLAGVVLVLLFCVLGVTLYAQAGPAQSVWMSLPFNQGLALDWRG